MNVVTPSLVPVLGKQDIPLALRGTPIGDLLAYHNFGETPRTYVRPELLIGMCMDSRKTLRIPDNFAFIMRAGGANFQRHEFKLSFAIALGGVRSLALIGHDDCGMVGLGSRREEFIAGLVENGGWDPGAAGEHFDHYCPVFEIGDAAGFVLSEAQRLGKRYPRVTVVPLFYRVVEGRLDLIEEPA